MDILISNEQDVPVDEGLLERLAGYALERQGVGGEAELSIALVTEDAIRDLNREYRGKDAPTDVLSFESGDMEGEFEGIPRLLGDVVICPSIAQRQAAEYGQSFEREMGLLLVHGILHLLGYDHLEDAEADAMEEREREILTGFFSPGGAQQDKDEK